MHDNLLHYGIKRKSGRYPWGSGEDPYQSEHWNLINKVDSYREKGLDDTEIAKKMGISTTELRSKVTLANKEIKKAKMEAIVSLKEQGHSNVDIAKKLDISESSVRDYIKKNTNEGNKKTAIDNTVNELKKGVTDFGYLDVGAGVERQLGISKEKLRAARKQLLDEGYYEHDIYVRQMTDPTKWPL